MKRTIGSILACCLLVSATAAFGGVKAGSFSITPLVGGYDYIDDPSKDTTLVLGARAGYNFSKSIGIEVLYDYLAKTDDLSGSPFALHRFGGQVLYHFFPDTVFVPYLATGYSGLNFDGINFDTKTHGAFDYGIGAKFFLTDDFALRGDIRHILYKYNSGSMNNLEYTLGVYFQFGTAEPVAKAIIPAAAPTHKPEPAKIETAPVPAPALPPPADSDNDGVIDPLDKCPNTPPGVAVDNNGCPLDSDGDGVPDYRDKCTNTPSGVAADSNGCPLDTDKDGVPDYLDTCPNTPSGVAVSSNGCPFDADRDKVPDYLDKCPNTPSGAAVDSSGCPLDTDKDGVADYLDKCPATAIGASVDTNGCSVEVSKRFCDKPAIIAITFDSNKADVKSEYYDDLDNVGNFLKDFPSSKGTIDGHTDSVGNKEINLKLSQIRAENVRSYIINKFGIDGSRISAKGYGSAKPVAPNKTAAGKARNRRIEAVFSCE